MSTSNEEQVIFATLESSLVDDGRVVRPVSEADEVPVDTLERLYLELLGLVPEELDPIEPRPETKRGLMERIAAADADAQETRATVTPHPRFLEAQAAKDGEAAPTRRKPRSQGFRPWLMAAVVALAMIGASFFLYFELRQGQETIADLQEQLEATVQRVELLAEGRVDVVEALRALSVSAPQAVDICPLRPTDDAVQPDAQGSLVLAMAQGQWYLRARDLAPAEGERTYVLWFLDADGQPIRRVALELGDDQAVELQAEGIPMTLDAATITLEPSGETARPQGPRVLYGHRREMERL